jgi:hypothetical protein
MGRPTKIDDVILLPDGKGGSSPRVRWEVIVDRVRAGVPPEVAAIATGVGRATYYRWMQRGEDRWIDGRMVRAEKRYRDFRDALDRAFAEAEAVAIAHIRKAGEDPKTWQAEAWYLERSRSERWRRRDTVHQAGPADGDPPVPDRRVNVTVEPDAAARLAELLGIVEGAGAPPDAGPGDEGAS